MCRLNNPFESVSICNQDTTVVLKNMQVVIQLADSHKEMNEYMEKYKKNTQLFFYLAKHFGERTLKTE